MTSAELVAAVPTDTAFARDKQGWEMPAAKLEPVLAERAKGRVLYADVGKKCLRAEKPEKVSSEVWDAFLKQVDESDPLFVDYHLMR